MVAHVKSSKYKLRYMYEYFTPECQIKSALEQSLHFMMKFSSQSLHGNGTDAGRAPISLWIIGGNYSWVVASTHSRQGPTSDRFPPPTVKNIFAMFSLLIAALHEMCDRNTAKYYLSDSQLEGSFKHKCLGPLRHFDGFKLPVRKIQWNLVQQILMTN